MTETRSLHRKLAQVMYEAERIPKRGKAPAAMGGFEFVQVGDAADVIRKALAEHNISMIPTAIDLVDSTEHQTSGGKSMTTVTVRTTWTLTDGESGETIAIQSMGSGADMGDKAIPKAQSSAMKYALLMGFLLSTGDDPELSDSSDRRSHASSPGAGADAVPPAASAPPAVEEETVDLLGNLQKTGKVMAGGAQRYKLEWWQQPEGHAVGFRLKLDGDDRDIPQVLVKGPIGEALFALGAFVAGQTVTVKGKLYNVRPEGKRSFYRLVVGEHPETDFIETPDGRFPALAEAEPVPAFSPEELQAAGVE